VGRYKLQAAIGEGRFGKVMVAQRDDKQVFAIKAAPRTSSRVLEEIKLLQMLPVHDNVIQVVELMATANNCYIVMELASMSLYQLIVRNKTLRENAARPLIRDIVAGLKHCHDHLISHRDIKPENILLVGRSDGTMVAKLADFGWAYAHADPTDENSVRNTFCGSLNYMAPEFFESVLSYNPYYSDMWSVGVVLFAMVSGHLPFDKKNQSELILDICRASPRYPASMSNQLVDLLQRILVFDPKKRLTPTEVLAHRWLTDTAAQ